LDDVKLCSTTNPKRARGLGNGRERAREVAPERRGTHREAHGRHVDRGRERVASVRVEDCAPSDEDGIPGKRSKLWARTKEDSGS